MSTMTVTPVSWIPSDESFGARLALIRQRFGWNLKEAAAHCGFPQASWRDWEIKGRSPRQRDAVVAQIVAATGVDTAWLQTGARPNGGPTGGGAVAHAAPDAGSIELGSKVSQILRFQGISEEALAKGLRSSRERVTALLEGRETWRAADIASAARVLGVSADWLLRLDSNQQPSD